ncbi:MAG: protein-disulfide reductase DsbD [Gammaproteobacteria bacterium]
MKTFSAVCLAWLFGTLLPVFANEQLGAANIFEDFKRGFAGESARREFLPPDEAFRVTVDIKDPATLAARWDIADGYYLYKGKFGFDLTGADVRLGRIDLPSGHFKDDPEFGSVEVHTGSITVPLSLRRPSPGEAEVALTLRYQGCAEDGICYSPMRKTLSLRLPAQVAGGAASGGASEPVAEHDALAQRLEGGAVLATLGMFAGFGILLAFTPCVFPMVPILSGIIAGQGEHVTTRKAFILSSVFVVVMAATYALMGVIAGRFGHNLQATFQNSWVLVFFAAVFVGLALSMFGWFELQLPAGWQTRLARASNAQPGGTLHGTAAMGLFSALIVGPCVAPPLAGALIYIGKTGDAVLGGMALFCLGIGMGLPLIAVGTSTGKLLPKAGPWMQQVKAFFGFGMLAVAVLMLERLLPPALTVLLWGLLLTTGAIFLGALDLLHKTASWGHRLTRGVGFLVLTYGGLLIVGAAAGATDMWRPFAGATLLAQGSAAKLSFMRVKGSAGLDRALRAARDRAEPVMVDLYADWCVECKELEKHTFADPLVGQQLTKLTLIKADVTANDEEDRELLAGLGVFGPPALLFYTPDGTELHNQRLVGFVEPEAFRSHLDRVLRR